MAWNELHQAVWTHRKTVELAARLRLRETYAAAHVIRLWSWALDNAPHGDLSTFSARVIAAGADWTGNPRQFVSALTLTGWLDPDRKIHDWHEYGGKLAKRRDENADRMRRKRAEAHAPDVQRTNGARAPLEKRREEKSRREKRTGDHTPLPPSPHAEKGEIIEALTDDDRQLWTKARALLAASGLTPGNVALLDGLEPVGIAPDGAFLLRAPPGSGLKRFERHVVKAMVDAGDDPAFVRIVESSTQQ